MIKTNQTSIFYPDYIAKSVLEIKPEALKRAGITHIAFDIDETIVPKSHNTLTKEYIKFMKSLEKAGFVLLVASNSKRDLTNITKNFNSILVPPTKRLFKPFKGFYYMVISAANTDASHIVMVGDKIINDVVGANRSGLHTILVEPYARRQKIHIKLYFKMALRLS